MKRGRLAALAVALAAAVGVPSAAVAESEPSLVRVDEAFAQWLFPTADPHRFTGRYVHVVRTTEPGARPKIRASVGDVRCTIDDGRRRCTGEGRSYRVRQRDLTFDDALGGVTVHIRTATGTSTVHWRPAGEAGERELPDGAYVTDRSCSPEGFGGGGTGVVQEARAAGVVEGRRVTVRRQDMAFFRSGAHVYRCGP